MRLATATAESATAKDDGSEVDIDKLLTIKDLLTKGFNLKAIDEIINEKEVSKETTQLRQIIHNDIFAGPSGLPRERSIGRGDLSRFYNNKKKRF